MRQGYVGVKNRAQEDIINRIPVKEAIAKEKVYFAQHEVYRSLPEEVLGCETLTKKLGKILFTHIKHSMPSIMNECRQKLTQAKQELENLGKPLPSSPQEKVQLIWSMTLDFLN